ncbi:glycoside hydrolase family 2 TIM barrel-domain containing protein [Robinsoniella peoriensis]|uniref:glycoside hydrolase family 2 TIM barrel-domain containing protein n=1 Tax=Robinsoniella peoriensis TaxID=180332 RepID=UPI0005C7B6D1|nr:glycoside hydrolase family 2 TIM barrel-domain containing protein [Robinsoniella peoriensis]
MIRQSFNEGWTVETAQLMEMTPASDKKEVTLPHDKTIELRRRACPEDVSADVKKQEALSGGWPTGTYKYRKEFEVPLEWMDKWIYFEFEGAYRDAHVLVDDDFVLHHSNGYTPFVVEAKPFLRFGKTNNISVILKNGADSRWYAGAGIYRPVHILVGELMHISPEGVRLHTLSTDQNSAVVEAVFKVRNKSYLRKTLTVVTTLYDSRGNEAAVNKMPVTVFPGEEEQFVQKFLVVNPQLWDADHPVRYQSVTILSDGDNEVDRCEEWFGIRTMQLDAKKGLRINGNNVLLRGGCIHADHGPLGMATFYVSEERRIKKLKEAGFNAIRMAHHPVSRALMEACDRLGMYIMDELTDMWGRGKTPDDYANSFQSSWETDVMAMVHDAYNHPSVIMYSIGNEIADIDYGFGGRMGRKIAGLIKELDPYRYTTNSINGLVGLAAMSDEISPEQDMMQKQPADGDGQGSDINNAMTDLVQMMETIMQMPVVGDSTEESYAAVDIAGYNYMEGRYDLDGQLYPNRVIVGSETYPPKIDYNWTKVKNFPYLIGDFTWAAWDYLGEAGIAHITYGGQSVYKNYPYRAASTGDLDIIGTRNPVSYYREIAFGVKRGPFIAVQKPQYFGEVPNKTPWCWSDSRACWTWPGYEEKNVVVEVYADAAKVVLTCNGKEIGQGICQEEQRYKMEVLTSYEPGELMAVAYDETGTEIGRYSLYTANGMMQLNIQPEVMEVNTGYANLVYFNITRTDRNGNYADSEVRIQAEVEGPGQLIGLSSGAPFTKDEFFDSECDTWNSTLLAIVRPTGEGLIRLRLSCEDGTYYSDMVKVN